MQTNKSRILSFLRENKALLKKDFGIKKIALYGSFARGEQTDVSDIDLLIESDVVTFKNRMRLKHFLQDNLHREVDIVYFDSVRTFIRRFIEEDLIYA